jgi:hypothetical protein
MARNRVLSSTQANDTPRLIQFSAPGANGGDKGQQSISVIESQEDVCIIADLFGKLAPIFRITLLTNATVVIPKPHPQSVRMPL